MHPDQHIVTVEVGPGDLTPDQSHVLDVLVDAGVTHRAEFAVPGRDSGLGDPLNVLLVLAAVLDQVGDGDQRQTVFVCEDPQFVGLRHCALVLLADDFADRPGRRQPRQPGQSTAASV